MSNKSDTPVPPATPAAPVQATIIPPAPTAVPPAQPTPPATPQKDAKPVISQETADELALAQYEAISRAGFPTEKTLQVMAKFAEYCVQTSQMPKTIDTAAKAIITFQAGRELGIPPMKSLYSFYFVNNKLTMYGPTVVERIRQWAKIEYGDCTAEEANVTITRKDDGTSLSSKVTLADLKARGITGEKDTYKKHARTMLIYKAVGEIVRHIVPEAVGAMAVEGDYGPAAEYEIVNEEKGRQGKTIAAPVAEVDIDRPAKLADLPTVAQIARKNDRDVIAKRLNELGVEFDPKATKGILAGILHEKLRVQLEAQSKSNGQES